MLFRIGVHLGEIIAKPDGTVYGDGVNIAARLQALAPPGGVAVSQTGPGDRSVPGVPYDSSTKANIASRTSRVPCACIFLDDGGGLVVQGPVSAIADTRIGNLPVQTTSLFGREGAVGEISTLLETNRLVTLLGMGGLGKTRLSIETATHVVVELSRRNVVR